MLENTSTEASPRKDSVVVSVVVPSFNEEGNLEKLYREVEAALAPLDDSWELIFSDDGSTDGTWGVIQSLHARDQRVKAVRLSRNFGHQYALLAGLSNASGEAVISMDADLQHPPSLIPTLLSEWRKGSKIVKTIRQDPDNLGMFKRHTSRLFYKVFSYFSGVKLESGMADYRLLDRQVLTDILGFREDGLFLRGIVQWVGYPSSSVAYPCADRFSGSTKYTLRKMIRFAWHGVSSFSVVPLRIGVFVGLAASGLAFAGMLYAIIGKLVAGHTVPGWASSVAIISFLFGVLFLLLGLLGEYIGRILLEARRRPRYIISERTGIDPTRPRSDFSEACD